MTAPFAIEGVDDAQELRRAFTLYPRGVMAVAAEIEGRPVGLAVSAFVSVSLDPPLIALCIDAGSSTWPTLQESPGIGVSVLTADQAWLGRQLASRRRDRFENATFHRSDSGALLLEGAATQLDCTIRETYPGGDHLIVILEVTDMHADPTRSPLVWHDSAFRSLAPIEP